MDRETNRSQGRQLTPEEREIRMRKRRRKRIFRITIVVVGFLLVVSAVVGPVIAFAAFRVKSFSVEGQAPYTNDEVIAASGIELGKSLLFTDVDEARDNIEKRLPYIDNVVITKKLPSSIVIRLESSEKTYAVELSNGTYAILNKNLKVLDYAAEIPEGITVIKGGTPYKYGTGECVSFISEETEEADAEDRTLALILEIINAIKDNEMKDINLIDISTISNIHLIYQNRIVLTLGDSSGITSKLSLGQRVISEEDKISLTQSGTINLTVAKKAYFNPSDPDDIKELVIFNGGEWEEIEPTTEESESETD